MALQNLCSDFEVLVFASELVFVLAVQAGQLVIQGDLVRSPLGVQGSVAPGWESVQEGDIQYFGSNQESGQPALTGFAPVPLLQTVMHLQSAEPHRGF